MKPWISQAKIDTIMAKKGWKFYRFGSGHNRTDGAADLIYIKEGKVRRLAGNYWDYRTFLKSFEKFI